MSITISGVFLADRGNIRAASFFRDVRGIGRVLSSDCFRSVCCTTQHIDHQSVSFDALDTSFVIVQPPPLGAAVTQVAASNAAVRSVANDSFSTARVLWARGLPQTARW